MSLSASVEGRRLALRPGHTRTLGAQIEEGQVNFALAAPHAEAVELCLFSPDGSEPLARLDMPCRRDGIWHGALPYVANRASELVYGWRVRGPWAPQAGHRFNPAKLLLDPCAREVLGHYDGNDIHLGHAQTSSDEATQPDPRDNAAQALKARVVDDLPPLQVPRPCIDPAQRVLYEAHVKGFTALHPDLPPELRGTYAGLAHPACLAYLQQLGVTTLSLMPVAFRADESRLLRLGLSNYWGYSPIAWSAPETRYWSGRAGTSARTEFRAMIDALHGAGIEVVLDVVYNHSGETDEFGPTLSLRGIDNALYYQLDPHDQSRYMNWTGCGNSIDLNQPLVLRTVMDSLRRWVSEYGVDGFRFDLAPTLARASAQDGGSFQQHAPWLEAIAQDPVLRECLLIVEPWDIGPDGYQLGAFPPGWLEWNDRFRDTQRAFWLHHRGTRGELARRLAGSGDVFKPTLRSAHSSVNFITAHDGFTLHDLVSYAERHNEANGEGNRDGQAHNLSTNNGIEGATEHADILGQRAQQRRALLGVLLLSLGTPMLLAGDELGHSQAGNNNAYCQDNATSWLDWGRRDAGLCEFVGSVLRLRRDVRWLQSRDWWREAGQPSRPVAVWYSTTGDPLSEADWNREGAGSMMLELADSSGQQGVLVLINAAAAETRFHPPQGRWILHLDTLGVADPDLADGIRRRTLQACEDLPPDSLWVAIRERAEGGIGDTPSP